MAVENGLPPNLNLLYKLVGNANVACFLNRIDSEDGKNELIGSLKTFNKPAIYCNPDQIQGLTSETPGVQLPRHVFPVYSSVTECGLVIPLDIVQSDEWYVSEAFGTFGTEEKTPTASLLKFLKHVENAWREIDPEQPMLARWPMAFNLRLLCPVHIDLFGGKSLQMPLLIAILRALCTQRTNEGTETVPFGTGPVFASGIVNLENGSFDPIGYLHQKLMGFVRELGQGRPALLTREQIDLLKKSHPEDLNIVQVREVNSLTELLCLSELKKSLLQHSRSAYHPTRNESILGLINSRSRAINFDDAKSISEWMSSHAQSPYYRFRLKCEKALLFFHKGNFRDGFLNIKDALSLLEQYPDEFGSDDIGRMLSILVDPAADARHPDEFRALSKKLDTSFTASMTAPQRVKVFGAQCQYFRFYGQHREAIQAGEASVKLADSTCCSQSGRARIYLAHAIIAAVREGLTDKEHLDKASRLILESKTTWLPTQSGRGRDSHLGFCIHLEAEVARLSGKPFIPPPDQYQGMHWGHPLLFTLLSCARNRNNPQKQRSDSLEQLVKLSHKYASEAQYTLFDLFDPVYRLYAAVLSKQSQVESLNDLNAWLDHWANKNMPGWKEYLGPLISTDMDLPGVETLCDAIRYH